MKALIITRDSRLQAEILALGAMRVPALTLAGSRSSIREALERPAGDLELVIIDASGYDAAEADLIARLYEQHPGACCVLLAAGAQQELLIRAMRAGVREVLQLPLVARALHEALDRIDAQAAAAAVRNGKVLAFIACKGGSGATFLSTNFCHAMATLAHKKVLMIDLHSQFGDATLYVSDQKPGMTLADICAQIARMDGALLDSCLVHITPGFGILAASDDPAHGAALSPEEMDSILHLARQHYDFIVLDVGRQIDPISLRALDHADLIYPVLQLALPDIRDARRLLDIFNALGYPPGNTHLIVNRYEKGGQLQLDDLEKTLGARVLHTVPNDYVAVSDSVNQGVPVLQLASGSAVARSLCDMVAHLTTPGIAAPEPKTLLGRLFGRMAFALPS